MLIAGNPLHPRGWAATVHIGGAWITRPARLRDT